MSGMNRLRREFVKMEKEPTPGLKAKPQENDIFRVHYLIDGPDGTAYQGGIYHGILEFPPEYPMKPPSVKMMTPSGRFSVNTKICMSMSDFHPESWNPLWNVVTILNGLRSFMAEEAETVGSIRTTDAVKKKFAAESVEYNCTQSPYKDTIAKLFPEHVELHSTMVEKAKKDAAAAAAAAASQESKTAESAKNVATSAKKKDDNNSKTSYWIGLALLVLLIALTVNNYVLRS